MLIKLLVVAGLIYLALVALVACSQSALVYYPQMGRDITRTPAAYGLPFEDLSLETGDGETLHAWWIPAAPQKAAVLLLHGNAGNISQRIDYARMFSGLGYSTLLIDYRGYGKSTGTPTEEGTYNDALTAWRWLTVTRGVADRDVIVFGESLGGAVAAWLAAKHPPRALVLASAFTSVPDLGAEIYWFIPVRLLSRFQYNTLNALSQVRAPVLIAHSRDDNIIPYSHGQKLFAAANEPKQFLDLAGGHNDGFIFTRAEWVMTLGEFLQRRR